MSYKNSEKVAVVHYGRIEQSPSKENLLRKKLDFRNVQKSVRLLERRSVLSLCKNQAYLDVAILSLIFFNILS